MRLALCTQLQQTVATRLPEVRVTRIFDGPNGYTLLLDDNGRRSEIRRKADLARLLPKRRK